MTQSAKQFIDLLEEKEIKFSHSVTEETKKDHVEIRYSGDNLPSTVLHFVFHTNGEDVALQMFNVVKNIPEGKIPAMLAQVNELNMKYRFAKFCLDTSDSTIQLEMDCPFRAHDVGDICFELLQRAITIADDEYPTLMKALWA